MTIAIAAPRQNSARQVLFASLVGTTIEFFDFYIYGTARCSGSSLTFNLAGIFGASLAPYIATWLANNYGLEYVGYYLSAAGLLSLAGLLAARETKDDDLHHH